ncbi:MAG: signal peptidase I, partial [Myxococcota bacterium]
QQPSDRRAKRLVMRILGALAVLSLGAAWAVDVWVADGGSMLPTLEAGEPVVVNRLAYGPPIPFTDGRVLTWGEPERGDVVLFLDRRFPESPESLKRVVATGGDTFRLEDDRVVVSGAPIPTRPGPPVTCRLYDETGRGEPACPCVRQLERLGGRVWSSQHWIGEVDGPCAPQGDWPPGGETFHVPAGHVFVLGDNRDNAEDSRVYGPVPVDDVVGPVVVTF